MNNRELIKELLQLSDETLKALGYHGMTGEHGRKVAEHYVNGGEVLYDRTIGYDRTTIETPSFRRPANCYTIPRKMILVNGIEVPAPESEDLEVGQHFYVPANEHEEYYYYPNSWDGCDFDLCVLERGLVYLCPEDAEARCKAMLKYEEVE